MSHAGAEKASSLINGVCVFCFLLVNLSLEASAYPAMENPFLFYAFGLFGVAWVVGF